MSISQEDVERALIKMSRGGGGRMSIGRSENQLVYPISQGRTTTAAPTNVQIATPVNQSAVESRTHLKDMKGQKTAHRRAYKGSPKSHSSQKRSSSSRGHGIQKRKTQKRHQKTHRHSAHKRKADAFDKHTHKK